MKFTISGDLGSGKSELCRRLAEYLSCDILSVGVLQRKMAAELNMSLLNFNKHLELHPEIDQERDSLLVELANAKDVVVVDSRMGWHFLPASFKIHLIVNPLIAAMRIKSAARQGEKYENVEEAAEQLKLRKASESKRFSALYSVNCDDYTNYNLLIDSSFATADAVFSLVMTYIDRSFCHPTRRDIWISSKNIIPTQSIRDSLPPTVYSDAFDIPSVRVGEHDERFYILDGHKRALGALKLGKSLVPANLFKADDFMPGQEVTVRDFVVGEYRPAFAYEWEEAADFRFDSLTLP